MYKRQEGGEREATRALSLAALGSEAARAAARAAEAREVAAIMAAREVVVRAMAPAHQQFSHVGRGGADGGHVCAQVAENCRGDAIRAPRAY